MLASDIILAARYTLLDPSPGTYWSDAELIRYLNGFMRWAVGLKPDLYPTRTTVQLVAGSDQQIPSDGHQFLDAHGAGNGQAVFLYDMATVKHAKFAKLFTLTAVDNVQVCVADPRDPRRYHVFPPATGTTACTLEIEYGAIPADLTALSDTYPLGPETFDAAYCYVLSLAYGKRTSRGDTQKAAYYQQRALEWFGFRTKVQFGEAPRPDEG